METGHAPELPTLGRALDLEGWARVALDGLGQAARSGRDVAQVLWSTACAAAAVEFDQVSAARAWFNDLALGRVVLPGHVLVHSERRAPGSFSSDGHARAGAEAALARHDELHAATVLHDDTGERPADDLEPSNGQRHADHAAQAATSSTERQAGFAERHAGARSTAFGSGPARRSDPRAAPLARRLEELVERPRARLLFTRRARWVHPAVRPAAVAVVGPPLVRGWINVFAFADAVLPNEGRTIDWLALRAATERATRLLDGLLTAHGHDPAWRRIGLGIAGLGDALERLGVPYGSDAACVLARRVAHAIAEQAHRTSVQLAEERGAFERWGETRWAHLSRQRRHALCTLSWPSDGLHGACGLSEGVAWHGVDDPDVPVPTLEAQVRLEVECQRAFEGVVAVQLVSTRDSADFDARALANALLELDVQCLAIEAPRHAELYPQSSTAPSAAHDSNQAPFVNHDRRRGDTPANGFRGEVASDTMGTGLPTWGGSLPTERPSHAPAAALLVQSAHPAVPSQNGRRAAIELTLLPAVRVDAATGRGRWQFDVVLDERSDRERELVLVTAPPGADGWRLFERLNGELARGVGLAAAVSTVAAELLVAPAATDHIGQSARLGGDGARELAEVLTQFVQSRRLLAAPARADAWRHGSTLA